jgi:hypothetical protein
VNISITIDDNGNPIFSQEGTLDMDSVIRDVLIDQENLKDVFQDKFKSLAESIKIDNKKISNNITKGVTDLFTFSSDFKKDVQSTFKNKIEKMLDSISVDKKGIEKSLNELFLYKDKDKELKNVFDKINSSIPASTKGGSDSKQESYLAALAQKNSGLLPIELQNIAGSVFSPHILDVNVVDMDSGIMGILSNELSTAISEKNYEKLAPLFDTVMGGDPQAIGGEGTEDTVFESEATPVHLLSIEPSLLESLQKAIGLSEDDGKNDTEKVNKKGGILAALGGILGFGGIMSFASLKSGLMSKLASMMKLPTSFLKFATNPITMLLAGVVWGVVDGVKATFKADEWGVSKGSAGLAGFLAGSTDGLFANMGKWALLGAGVGTLAIPIPIVGTIVGGLIGTIIGAIFSAIGAEKLAQKFDGIAVWFDKHFGVYVDGITVMFQDVFNEIAYTWGQIKTWYNESLKPAIDKFKSDMQPVIERLGAIFNDVFIPTVKKLFDLMVPVFETITEFISETLWPTIKKMGHFFGEGLIQYLGFLPIFIDEVITQTGVVMGDIKKGFEKFGEAMYWVWEKIESLSGMVKNLWPFKDDEEKKKEKELKKQLKELKDNEKAKAKEQQRIEDQKKKLAEAEAKEGNTRWSNKQRAIDLANAEILEAQNEIAKLDQAKANIKNKQLTPKMDKLSDQPLKIQDANISPKGIQVQLDQKDTLETIGNQSVYSKEGGTLDKAIDQVSTKLQTQLDEMSMFKEMFKDYMKYVSNYNTEMLKIIPTLGQGSLEPQLPAETSVSNGYIRDPNYEWRMKMREVL